jgi:DNA-binding NtrC family response regulator
MGLSQRAQAWVHNQAILRAQERFKAQQEQERLEAEYHATFLDRTRAAEYLGISLHKLRRMMTAGTLPAPIKGEHKQSPPRWHIDHLREFKATMPDAGTGG